MEARRFSAGFFWPVIFLTVLCACSSKKSAPAARTEPTAGSQAAIPSAPATEGGNLAGFLSRLPNTPPPRLNREEALFLSALALSCIDRPQTISPQSLASLGYLYKAQLTPLADITNTRAFYGCYDWHSAVNSTWTLAALVKQFPDLPVASLIREKLNAHLGKNNLAGELSFIENAKGFERPYGQSWLLKLYATLHTWNDPDARKWSANLAPLVKFCSANMQSFIQTLPYPTRVGVHPNTAYSMNLLLDFADATQDAAMRKTVAATANRFFAHDADCPTAYEPGSAEFLSPCLEEAKLMSRLLAPAAFLDWFNHFLPAVDSGQFQPLWASFNVAGITKPDELAGKSHLIGLSFARAEAMVRIADALPAGDPRAQSYRRLAAINAAGGMKDLEGAGYLGSHWLGTYALSYLLAAQSPSGLPVVPPKPAGERPAEP